jgi:hypothetical protein
MFRGIANHPSPPHLPLTHLKLRFDEGNDFAGGGKKGYDRGKNERERDEGDIDHHKIRKLGELTGGEMPNIHPFQDHDSGIVPETLVQVTVAHIQSNDPGRASLKETIGKTAGPHPDVNADPVLDRDAKDVERGPKLDAPSSDEGMLRTLDGDRRSRPDQGSRFIDALTIDSHLPGEDQSARTLSALDQPIFEQAQIQAFPRHHHTLSNQPSAVSYQRSAATMGRSRKALHY